MNFDSTKNYSPANVGDNPVVNLACGRLRFGFDDGAIGGNSYAIGVSHVYNSLRYHDDQTVGNGWQLSVMQRVFRHEQNYLVVDASGETHCFKPYYANKYYDETNARSVLTADENGFVLSDEVGNKVAFNADGLPVSVTSAVNGKIEKVFAYQDGRLVSIYDKRKVPNGQTRAKDRVELSYQDDKLAEMRFIVKNKPVSAARYTYQGDNLVSVSKVAFTDNGVELLEKQFMKFAYDSQNRLVAVTDAETLDAMRFTYNSGGALFKTESGFVTQDGLSAGQGISLGQIQATEPNEQFVCVTSKKFYYHTYHSESGVVADFVNKTVVEDEKGISLAYYIDSNFNIVSQFELVDGSLKTLQKEEGKRSGITGEEIRDYINQEPVLRVSKEIGKVYHPTNCLQMARSKAEQKAKVFGYSFWLKHNENCERMWVKFAVNCNLDGINITSNIFTSFVVCLPINGRATGCWQKVTIPFAVQKRNETNTCTTDSMNAFTLCLLKDDKETQAADYFFKEIGFAPSTINTFGVVADSYLPTVMDYKMKFGLGVKIDEKDYFSDSDISATFTNKMIAGNDQDVPSFDIICNNGTKRIANASTFQIEAPLLGTRNVTAIQNYSQTTFGMKIESKTSFSAKTILYTTTASSEDGEVQSSAVTTSDYYGNTLSQTDEYGLKTEYTYDQYGNPLTQSSYNAKGVLNRKVVLNYDADGEYSVQEKKCGSATQGHYSQTDVKTDRFGNVSSSNTRILSLDDKEEYANSTTDNAVGIFNDKQVSSTFGGNGTYVQNSVTYQNGVIRTISDGTVKYGRIRTRKPNEDSVAYTQFNQSGVEKIIRKDTVKRTGTNNQNTLNTTDFYNNEGKICYTKTSVADKYGKVGKITVNNKDRVAYTYRNVNGSELSAQVETVQDIATGVTRKYLFDDDGNRIGWKDYPTSAGQKKSQLIVHKLRSGGTKCSFAVDEVNNKAENYLLFPAYEQNKMSPRIAETIVFADNGTKFDDNDFKYVPDYHRKYVYNDDGELQRKYTPFGDKDFVEETTYGYTDVNGEKLVSNLTQKMQCFSKGEQNEYTNKCTYTGTNVTRYESAFVYPPDAQRYEGLIRIPQRTVYRYDQFNRLVEESDYFSKTHKGVREYSYLSNGRHKVFAGKNCEYDNIGRMSSCGTTRYTYDLYGNRTKEVDGSTTIEYSYLDKEQLYSVSKNGKAVASYRYDAEGNRACKSLADGTKITYYLDGNKLLGEDRTKDNKTHKLRYFYDAFGVIGFKYDDDYYCYIKDIFGSVVALYKQENESSYAYGQVVALYEYMAYGECAVLDKNNVIQSSSTFIGNVNPIRWKGQYFDAESGLYYTNFGYFDSKCGQYVNSRQISSLFDEILHFKGLDRHGILCNNILTVAMGLDALAGIVSLIAVIRTISKVFEWIDYLATAWDTYKTSRQLKTHIAYFLIDKNASPFAEDMKLNGVSTASGMTRLNGFSWGLSKADIFGVALSVLLDVCDSLERGVSPEAIVLGATFTALKGVALIYIDKAIIYVSTAIGSHFSPAGAAIGFVVGVLVAFAVNVIVNIVADKYIDELVEEILA